MHSEILIVTPDMAKQWIITNKSNRPVKSWAVNRYAKDMIAGNWSSNHQGIAFDMDGNLADGQHRLLAIIKSGISIKMLVTWGVERVGIDRLAPRSLIDEIKYSTESSWIENKYLKIANAMIEIISVGTTQRKAERTTKETIEFCEKNRDVIEATCSMFTKNEKYISAAIIQATIALCLNFENKDKICRFVEVLKTGLPRSESEFMAVKAREFLIQGNAKGGATERKNASKTIMKAVYLFCRGESLSRLVPPKEFCYKVTA